MTTTTPAPTITSTFGTNSALLSALEACMSNAFYYDAAESPQWTLEREAREANAARLRELRAEASRRGLAV